MARRDREQKRKRKGGVGSVISTIIMLAALGVFCFAAYNLITIYLAYKAGTDEYTALEAYADTAKETESLAEDELLENETLGADEWGMIGDSENETEIETEIETDAEGNRRVLKKVKVLQSMENPVDFDSLLAMNEDIVGWLEIEALDISYPVVQGEDNDYYLHRTFQGQDNFAGSIFVDFNNRGTFSDRNTVVYGHNMKNGSMFGTLSRFREQSTYDESPYFWIYTPTRIYKYEIFSCAEVDKYSENYQITFTDAQDFTEFIERSKAQSLVENDVEVTTRDRVVTLSTCTGNDATRFIVQAKRVRTFRSVPKAGGYGETEES